MGGLSCWCGRGCRDRGWTVSQTGCPEDGGNQERFLSSTVALSSLGFPTISVLAGGARWETFRHLCNSPREEGTPFKVLREERRRQISDQEIPCNPGDTMQSMRLANQPQGGAWGRGGGKAGLPSSPASSENHMPRNTWASELIFFITEKS